MPSSSSDSDSDEEAGTARAAALRESPTPTGFMQKKGGFRRNWNRRWWVLDGGCGELAYYDDDDKEKRKGAINLFDASEVRHSTFQSGSKAAKSREMEIVTSDRTWRIRAESKEELEAWIAKLQLVIWGQARRLPHALADSALPRLDTTADTHATRRR